jgi:hypothetical protein
MRSISATDLLRQRMTSLLLSTRETRTPAQIVEWFGAMQAQDLASGEWSFGARGTDLTQAAVQQATVDRQIVRTWPMRGTIHFVPPRDAAWMLEVTGSRALAGAPRRREVIGLDERAANQAVDVLGSALAGGRQLRRSECIELLTSAGLITAPEHGYHLLWYCSQVGVSCIGPQAGKEQTFVLLDEWVPEPRRLEREEAIALLVQRYYQSHGPGAESEFARWSGLGLGDTRRALAANSDTLGTADFDGTVVIYSRLLDDVTLPELDDSHLLLLPGFDEYITGFKDRSAFLDHQYARRITPGNNAVFKPTIVHRGRVVGTWQAVTRAKATEVRATPFDHFDVAQIAGIEAAAELYGSYFGRPVAVVASG